MPTVTWDTAFEASPADTDEAKYGAGKIRQLKVACSERGELEFNWKTGTQPFAKAGKLATIFTGTTAEIAALTGMTTDSWTWDTTLSVLKRYTGSAWAAISIDHGLLTGLADDDHTQYLHLAKASQTLTEDLLVTADKKIDGRDLSVDGAALDLLVAAASRLKFLTTPVNKINWTAAAGWTDVDISANTGADTAIAALLAVDLQNTNGSPYVPLCMSGWFRKNGTSGTTVLPRIRSSSFLVGATIIVGMSACIVVVECDTSEIFETLLQTDSGSFGSCAFKVDLMGYFI